MQGSNPRPPRYAMRCWRGATTPDGASDTRVGNRSLAGSREDARRLRNGTPRITPAVTGNRDAVAVTRVQLGAQQCVFEDYRLSRRTHRIAARMCKTLAGSRGMRDAGFEPATSCV
jgi:hypothetical protein